MVGAVSHSSHGARRPGSAPPWRWGVRLALTVALLVVAGAPWAAAGTVARTAPWCEGQTYSPSNPHHYLYPNPNTTYDAQGFAVVDLRASSTAMVVFEDPQNPVKARVYGTPQGDLICTGAKADRVWAGPGHDHIYGGSGNDRLLGQEGNDYLEGDRGSDRLFGGPGADDLRGDRHQDDAGVGVPAADRLVGGANDDVLYGMIGNDTLEGGLGNDALSGGEGNDILWGGGGDDDMQGESGNDCFDGGAGYDTAFEFADAGVDSANSNVELVQWVFETIEHGGACS